MPPRCTAGCPKVAPPLLTPLRGVGPPRGLGAPPAVRDLRCRRRLPAAPLPSQILPCFVSPPKIQLVSTLDITLIGEPTRSDVSGFSCRPRAITRKPPWV